MAEPRRDHYIAPSTGDDSEEILDAAIGSLSEQRGLGPGGDAAARLHLLASLIAEADRRLPAAVTDARDQGCSWAQIADLLGVTRASAWQRYAAGNSAQPGRADLNRRGPDHLERRHPRSAGHPDLSSQRNLRPSRLHQTGDATAYGEFDVIAGDPRA